MRVTNRMLINTVINNINRNLGNMARTQEQMSSGKAVNRPSDGPIVVARVMSFIATINANNQYKKNMEDAKGWVDTTESSLGMITDTLQRARELAVQGANSTMPPTSMAAIAIEIDQLLDEILQAANTSYGGRFLFGGSNTTSEPFTRSGADVTYNGNTEDLDWEVAPRVTLKVNENGQNLFLEAIDSDGDGVADKSIFELLKGVYDALINGDNESVGNSLGEFDQAIDHILSARAVLGAKSNRLEMALFRLDDTQINLTTIMSKLEDIDLAETVMNYQNQENVYKASLATGAMILQPSLIDYLR